MAATTVVAPAARVAALAYAVAVAPTNPVLAQDLLDKVLYYARNAN